MDTSSEQLSSAQIIAAVSYLSLPELEQVFDHLLALQAKHKAAYVSAVEAALLTCINQGLPTELRERITLLRTKREEDTITEGEYEELTRLTDQAEELHADRMTALVELAKVRGLNLSALMDQLGIHFPEHV